MKGCRHIFPFILLLAVLSVSCSTTRVLAEGECRLASNDIKITGDSKFNTNKIEPYIKQKPGSSIIFGWNPFLNVYNWGGGKDNFFGKLFRKIGTPPVVFNPDLVESSAENMTRHLEYLGYYGSVITPEVTLKNRIAKVRYNVELGHRYEITDIVYELPDNSDFRGEV